MYGATEIRGRTSAAAGLCGAMRSAMLWRSLWGERKKRRADRVKKDRKEEAVKEEGKNGKKGEKKKKQGGKGGRRRSFGVGEQKRGKNREQERSEQREKGK